MIKAIRRANQSLAAFVIVGWIVASFINQLVDGNWILFAVGLCALVGILSETLATVREIGDAPLGGMGVSLRWGEATK